MIDDPLKKKAQNVMKPAVQPGGYDAESGTTYTTDMKNKGPVTFKPMPNGIGDAFGSKNQGGISQFTNTSSTGQNMLSTLSAPAMPEVKTAQAVTREVNQPTDTVQGQLSSLLKTDNPLMTSARTKATDYMNSRGLQNSTMAAQAGEQAVIETAFPIAQQDASTYFNQGLTNQGEQNTTNRFNVNEQNKPILQQQQFEQSKTLQTQGEQHQLSMQDIDNQFKSGILDREQAHQLRMQTIDNDFKSGLLDKEQSHQLKMQSIDNDVKSGILDREQAHQLRMQIIDNDFKSGLVSREEAQAMRMAEFEADVRENLLTLEGQNRLDLEKIAQDNARILNVSRDAMEIYRQTLGNISNIQADPNTTKEQKQAQINSEKVMLQNAISLAEGVTGTDLSGSIDWNRFDQVSPQQAAPASTRSTRGRR